MYFIKRAAEQIKKENFKTLLSYGDVCHLPLDHLSFVVDTVGYLLYHKLSSVMFCDYF